MPADILSKADAFWKENDQVGYQILLSMASSENIGSEISDALNDQLMQLDKLFAQPGGVDFEQSPVILKFLASLNVIIEFYLLQKYEMGYPGASADILSLAHTYSKDAEYGNYAATLLRRHIVFERMKIMRRVFADDRLTKIGSFVNENGSKYLT